MRLRLRFGMSCVVAIVGGSAAISNAATPAWQAWLAHVPAAGVNWDDTPFGETVAWLRDSDQTGAPLRMNVVLDRAALESAGVDVDSEVTLEVSEVPMARILDLLLGQLTPDDRLAYVIDDKVLRITTKDRLSREMTIRTYDLSGLAAPVPDFTSGPTIRMELTERAATGSRGSSPGGTGPTFDPGMEESTPGRSERIRAIVEAVQTTVEPGSWAENGGEGTMAVVGTTLVVRNSAANQEMIAGLLSRLSK